MLVTSESVLACISDLEAGNSNKLPLGTETETEGEGEGEGERGK